MHFLLINCTGVINYCSGCFGFSNHCTLWATASAVTKPILTLTLLLTLNDTRSCPNPNAP